MLSQKNLLSVGQSCKTHVFLAIYIIFKDKRTAFNLHLAIKKENTLLQILFY